MEMRIVIAGFDEVRAADMKSRIFPGAESYETADDLVRAMDNGKLFGIEGLLVYVDVLGCDSALETRIRRFYVPAIIACRDPAGARSSGHILIVRDDAPDWQMAVITGFSRLQEEYGRCLKQGGAW